VSPSTWTTEAWDAPASTWQNSPHLVIERASIYEIPYESEFDIAFSIGVIHHPEHPDIAIEQLVKATKSGGRILIWVYGYENLEF
jgi:SAM-dependent methyltransferase